MKTLNDLPIGAMFADKDRPHTVLRVAGRYLDGYPGIIGVCDNIIKQGCFDASEPQNPDSARRKYGNNNYFTSNIRQWLNADGDDWYSTQHEHDAPPIAENIFDGDNPYAADPGFLTRFSQNFKSALAKAYIKTRNPKTDEIETAYDSVWLLSATEIGFDEDGDEGVFLPLFADFRMKVAAPTHAAVVDANYQPDNFTPKEGWPYWLRSPYFSYSYLVRIVRSDGSETITYAYSGYYGLRPALLLKSDISVSEEPDERGVHIIE